MKKNYLIFVIIGLAILVFILTPLIRMQTLNGVWYLCAEANIKTEECLSEMSDPNHILVFYKNIEYSYDKISGKDGSATYYTTFTNRLYIGDGIFKYRILHKNGEKVLVLTVISEKNKKTQYYIYADSVEKFRLQ